VYIVNVLEGFDYLLSNALRYGIRIANCSFATTGPFDPDDPVNIATRALYDNGISVVFAAGNYGPAPDTLSPYAVAPWVIGVASGDKTGRLSRFSSRGIFDEGLYHPTLTAPGEAIVSTSSISLQGVFGVSGVDNPTGGATVPPAYAATYSAASGTSFAAPHVAGVAALMLQANPTLSPGQIKRILQQTATPMMSRDRSEAGAGYLDAWAALALALDASRGFGSFIPDLLDQRAWRYLFDPAVTLTGTVPAAAQAILPIELGSSSLVAQLGIAWGPFPSPADLDLQLYDWGGAQMDQSASFNAAGLFGSNEGVTVYRPVATRATAVVSFRTPSPVDQVFTGRFETVQAVFDAYPDIAQMTPADRRSATVALTSLAITGRNNCFCSDGKLSRGEAARLVAMAGQVPQTIPASATFTDVPLSDASFPFVESLANPQARRGQLIAPKKAALFGASNDIERLDLAMAAIKALGLRGAADARAGETLGLVDEASLPAASKGYVALTLQLGILRVKNTPAGPVFDPGGSVTRLEAARAATAMVGYFSGASANRPPGSPSGGRGTGKPRQEQSVQ
ncbi:MAG TPA: S8 family serine peptidase, partial [Patescibacteria group bacterium]|nr:S8 family serine peptidase [Patescibacteria group bacterium]